MPVEKRVKKRETIRAIAEYTIRRLPKKQTKQTMPQGVVKTLLLDISIGGCAVDSPFALPSETVISVRIDPLPFALESQETWKNPLLITGVVRSCVTRSATHHRLGICFARIKKQDAHIIKSFIKSKERRKFPRWDMLRT